MVITNKSASKKRLFAIEKYIATALIYAKNCTIQNVEKWILQKFRHFE